jgi:glycosyltransferase involved in cell wall biosynthesis
MKRDLIIVPIEPLEERYSASWYRNLPKAFGESGFNVSVITGDTLQATVKVGSFLDINSTVFCKASQIQQIAALFDAGKVKQQTVFFFSDIEFWGVESIRLMADMNGIDIKLAGFCHAASYTREDAFAIAAPYQQYTEVGWIAAFDLVMVGSQYHKDAIIARRLAPLNRQDLADRIVVTGNPLFRDDYVFTPGVKKEKLVVLANRLDMEKRPLWTLWLFEIAKARHPDWTFAVTSGRSGVRSNSPQVVEEIFDLERRGVIQVHVGINKAQYHSILERAMVTVSHSIEENFGYVVVESAVYGCAPMVSRGLSHTEIVNRYHKLFLPDRCEEQGDIDLSEDLAQLEWVMDNPWYTKGIQSIAEPYFSATEIMASHLKDFYDKK